MLQADPAHYSVDESSLADTKLDIRLGKTEVNGTNVDPLWEWMKNEKPGILGLTRIKWNFGKAFAVPSLPYASKTDDLLQRNSSLAKTARSRAAGRRRRSRSR